MSIHPRVGSRKADLLTVIIVSCLAIIQWQIFTPGFLVMDDALMMLISEGYFTGTPEASLVFMHILPSLLLKTLYEWYPGVNWYVFWQAFLLILAINALTLLFQRRLSVFWSAIPFVFFPAVFYLIDVQYTATSILLGAVGWLFFYDHLSFRKRRKMLLASAFWLLCYWTRWHGFLLVLLLQLPYLFFLTYQHGYWRRLLVWPALLACFYVLQTMHSWYYRYEFGEMNTLQYQRAIDLVRNGRDTYDSMQNRMPNLSRAEYDLIRNWYWIDSDYLSPERIMRMAKYAIQAPVFQTGVDNLIGATRKLRGYIIFLLILALPFIGRCWQNAEGRKLFALFLATTLIFYAYFGLFHRLPFRLSYPIVSCQFLVFCYALGHKMSITRRHLLGLVLVGAIVTYKLHGISVRNEAIEAQAEQNFEFLSNHPQVTFIAKGSALAYEGLFSWLRPLELRGTNLIATGWNLHTASYEKQLDLLGIENLAITLLSGQHNLVLVNPPLAPLQDFLCSRYGKRLILEPYPFSPEYKGEIYTSWQVLGSDLCR
jgi:hypothetical protein